MQFVKISGGKPIFAVRNAYATTNVAVRVQEVDTFTLPALAGATDGDYCVAYDATGNGWAIAMDTTGAAAATPTGAIWAAIPAGRKKYLDVSTTTTATQMATAVAAGFKALAGSALATPSNALIPFTAVIVATTSTSTVICTSVGYAVNTAPAVKNKDDSGAGSVTVARTTTGVGYTDLSGASQLVNVQTGLTATKTPDLVNRLEVYDNSGKTLVLAIGAAGAEIPVCWVPPGGLPMTADVIVPASSRLVVAAIDAAATTNELLIFGVQ